MIVLIADSANIRAVHAEGDAPALRDAHAPLVGGPPVQALQPIGWSRQRPRRPRPSSADRITCSRRTCAGSTPLASLRQSLDCAARSSASPNSVLQQDMSWIPEPEAVTAAVSCICPRQQSLDQTYCRAKSMNRLGSADRTGGRKGRFPRCACVAECSRFSPTTRHTAQAAAEVVASRKRNPDHSDSDTVRAFALFSSPSDLCGATMVLCMRRSYDWCSTAS